MIRPPVEALRERPWRASAVVLLWAITMTLPGLLGFAALSVHSSTERWLQRYRPVVYLKAHAPVKARAALEKELEGWAGVRRVTTRSPDAALRTLRERLGAEQVEHLGLSASVLPTSLVLEPRLPVQGHIELAARVASLEARDEVELVSAPDARALQLLEAARALAILGALVWLVLLASAVLTTWAMLRDIQGDERQESALMELFGARRDALRQPTHLRGVVLGLWGGVAASGSLVVVLLVHQHSGWFPENAQADPRAWVVALLPLLLTPAFGALSAQLATLPRQAERPDLPEGISPMLVYDWGTTPLVS